MDILNEINSDPKSLSPLVLAYIGDAVFELMVRGYVLKDGNAPVNKLNKKSRNIVNAASDYRRATGVEAIFGYVYLSGNVERLKELFKICVENEVL